MGLSAGGWAEGSCRGAHHPPGCPGPGQCPRLALLRRTDQLGLGVPGTPLYAHQPLPA